MSGNLEASAGTRKRGMAIALWALQILLGVVFIGIKALPDLSGNEGSVKVFAAIGVGQWLRYFVGTVELIGGLGLLVPRLSGLAAAGLSLVTLGAVVTQWLVLGATVLVAIPATVTVLLLLVAWGRLPETKARRLLASS